MKYAEFRARACFNREDLVFFAYGTLVEDPPENFDARLPAPPFLMLDRVLSFKENGKQGSIFAEQDIRMDAWYFQCHMPGDPVQPGGVSAWMPSGSFSVFTASGEGLSDQAGQ